VPTYKHITFLTDFGVQDDYAGVCRGVMKRIAPDAQIINITHGIGPMAVTEGALMLARAVPYMPVAVHLAVVDPGVGGSRRAIAIRASDERVYVGPDNGLLTLAVPREQVDTARHLTNPRYHLEHVSRTFHARDVFAPVAAHIAAGVDFDDLGDEIDPESLICIDLPEPSVSSSGMRATVLVVDRFGNLQLNLTREHIDTFGVAPGDRVELRFELDPYYAVVAETYSEAARGALMLYEDSYGAFAIAISGGNARELTGAAPGDEVRIGRAYD
jgi:S-adenosyl-L-methionine hydrolase (adenosine-forming)